jgi:hypothetical protein
MLVALQARDVTVFMLGSEIADWYAEIDTP